MGQDCHVETTSGTDALTRCTEFTPQDINALQTFQCSCRNVRRMRIVFNDSTDFYGRVTIYMLEIVGSVSDDS